MVSKALHEAGQLAALPSGAWTGMLSTPALERMTRLAMRTLRVPIARIVLADASGAPFDARSGSDAGNGLAECAFCLHTMRQGSLVVVEDALKDVRFADHAMVTGATGIRFYAGMPIRNADGATVGALCAIDFQARTITQDELDTLGDLAYLAGIEIARQAAQAALAALHCELEQRVEERTLSLRSANLMLFYSMAQQAHSQQALKKREAELSAVIENANDAYVCIDEAGVVTAWNQQAGATFGWSADEAIGRLLDELIIPPQLRKAHRNGMQRYLASRQPAVLNQRLELSAMRRDGSMLPVEVRIRALDIAGQTIFSAFLHDITERKCAEASREREARHDALTGLPNRRALFEMLPQAIARADRSGSVIALLFVDLDGFKAVNDAWGHAAGDTLLCEIGRRLTACLRQTDSVARLGGDEFTVLLEGLSGNARSEAIAIAEKLLDSMRAPVQIGAASTEISGSIGLAFYLPDTAMSPDLLVKGADIAMYHAKRAGKSRMCLAAA
jgi:diguanylate cyclase (GGDEF)-like protein/PAS domain S-box-containing protein